MRRFSWWTRRGALLLIFAAAAPCGVQAYSQGAGGVPESYTVGGAAVVRGEMDIPAITADNDYDLMYALGYVHAQDRLFQMDVQRRLFSGTLTELLGSAALAQDIQLRTFGLRRAAAASLETISPESLTWLQAYADGVNAFLDDTSTLLPPEYSVLEISREHILRWTVLDSLTIAKGLAFGLSFDLADLDYTVAVLSFETAGAFLGFDGTALFFQDLYRTAPFDPAISIPGFLGGKSVTDLPDQTPAAVRPGLSRYLDFKAARLASAYRDSNSDIPALREALDPEKGDTGSNWWITSGSLTSSGHPILANDPHLSLDQPATFYEASLRSTSADAPMNVFGVTFPGAPMVVQGCTSRVCWGSTVHPMDVTDVFQERLALNPADQLPMATYFDDHWEVLVRVVQKYYVNVIGDGVMDNLEDAHVPRDSGGMTFIVPRRNNGPIIAIDSSDLYNIVGLSVQYVGWGATREVDAFRIWARASNLDDFQDGLQYFDFGSQNWGYADVDGNIAYFTSGEMPLREDLQLANAPDGGVPPFLIRDGTHQLHHEWMLATGPQAGRSSPYEILPFDEMPHEVNPARGYILNANNDPVGTSLDNNPLNQLRPGGGLYYLNAGYATGFRIGRIQRLYDQALASGTPLDVDQIRSFQANNQLLDAEVFAPKLVAAYDAAAAGGTLPAGANPNLEAAIDYLRGWDFSTPTGIQSGYDPGDDPFILSVPNESEVEASIAATLYAVWRSRMVTSVIDAPLAAMGLGSLAPPSSLAVSALRNLIDNIDINHGLGASGIPFIAGGDVSTVMLTAMSDALDLLASDAFAEAFGGSTNLEDYRWGSLHRIVFDHPMGGPFSVPTAGGLPNLAPNLPGVSRAGGFGAVDASAHSVRAASSNGFMFGHGPARRFVGHLVPGDVTIYQTIPGGASGVIGSPHQIDALMLWLTNGYLEHTITSGD